MLIEDGQLKTIMPSIRTDTLAVYGPILRSVLPKYFINTAPRIAAFIAQTGYECINFTTMSEIGIGAEYERRVDLGNTSPGDGPRFKGRGAIQITGRGNYAWCSKGLFGDDRLLKTPELLLQPQYAIASACWFWTVAKPTLNNVCDQPETYKHRWHDNDYSKIQWITLLINGGQNGISVRTANYNRARAVFNF